MCAVHIVCRECQLAFVVGEVESINVVYISVSVVIYAVSGNLALVYPHILGEVFVIVFYSLVNHRHNYVRIAGTQLPGCINVGIGSCDCGVCIYVARIVVMPLHSLRPDTLIERKRNVPYRLAGLCVCNIIVNIACGGLGI